MSAKHGHWTGGRPSLTYSSWNAMKSRCLRRKSGSFKQYGAAGIGICERWMSFENFLKDMGERPSSDHSIDRVDNSIGYHPTNCRWANRKEQCRNRKSTVLIMFGGMSATPTEWANSLGLTRNVVRNRIKRGWTTERAVTTGNTKAKL